MRTLIGPLIFPDGTPMANARIYLRSARVNWSAAGLVASSVEQMILTNDTGQFATAVAFGDYHVWLELPESLGKQKIGQIVVEAGSPIELGELIELSRDATADWSISADWATQSWVLAQITVGAVPYAIALSAFNPGAGTAGQLYKVSASGLLIEPFTLQLKNYPTGNGVSGGLLYEKPDGKPGTLPVRRKVTGDTLAVRGDEIEIDMNAAAGDITITLPAGFALGDRPVTLYIISDTYLLPHTINILRNGAQTIEGIADDLQIKRRRSMVLRAVGGNDVRFT